MKSTRVARSSVRCGMLLVLGCLGLAPVVTAPAAGASAPGKAPVARGSFKVAYGANGGSKRYAAWLARLKKERFLEEAVGELNAHIAIPRVITMGIGSAGEPRAYYQRGGDIVLSCEFLEDVYDKARASRSPKDSDYEQASWRETLDVVLFVLHHEVGHALIDALELPVTGREEDAADQFAAYFLLENGDHNDHYVSVLAAAALFARAFDEDKAKKPDDLLLWGVHALSQQRYFNLECWLLASVENKPLREELRSYLVLKPGEDDPRKIPPQRLDLAEDEYALLKRSWKALLAPHIKAPLARTTPR